VKPSARPMSTLRIKSNRAHSAYPCRPFRAPSFIREKDEFMPQGNREIAIIGPSVMKGTGNPRRKTQGNSQKLMMRCG
jgi:hypothetical protein